jgi:hypothetical protein
MEPRQDESQKAPEPRQEAKEKRRRFQIVKLEERIAPAKGGNGTHNSCGYCLPPHFTEVRFGC